MTKLRVFIFLLTMIVVGVAGIVAIFYAKGYRLNKDNKLSQSGLLVVNSDPNGAQIIIDGKLNSATNATITLEPKTYDVTLKKEGYINWEKKITIEKGIVTEIDANLFPEAASLNPLTFSGAINPLVSPDYSKIIYGTNEGIWVIETLNLPLGFNSQPVKITDLVPDTNTSWQWSPDSRQVLVTNTAGTSKLVNANYLLDISGTTLSTNLIDVTATLPKIKADWELTKIKELNSLLAKLPDPLKNFFDSKTTNIVFSPDQTKILYQATDSGKIPDGIITALPGSSTQKQIRDLAKNNIYVYDLKEDRNFQVSEACSTPCVTDIVGPIYWFASSRNLLIPEKDKVVISDYDNTNKQVVYGGSYIYPIALPTPNINRIFILTNLGAAKAVPNLYSLNLR